MSEFKRTRVMTAALPGNPDGTPAALPEIPLVQKLRELELTLVREAMDRTGGNQTHAAVLLGVRRSTLCMRIRGFRREGLL